VYRYWILSSATVKYDAKISTQGKHFDAYYTACQYISFCYDSDYDNDAIDISVIIAVCLKVGMEMSL